MKSVLNKKIKKTEVMYIIKKPHKTEQITRDPLLQIYPNLKIRTK